MDTLNATVAEPRNKLNIGSASTPCLLPLEGVFGMRFVVLSQRPTAAIIASG